MLDILFTKSKQYITDLKIIDTERYCVSDHYAITFNISHNVNLALNETATITKIRAGTLLTRI